MIEPELSRMISVDQLGTGEKTIKVEAGPDERAALSDRFGILSITALTAAVRLKVMPGGVKVRLRGHIEAEVVQACVVTLEPVAAHVVEDFELYYGPEADEEGEEIVIDVMAEDPPEPIIGGAIDIGEAVAEHLALALEPFPRAPGAQFTEVSEEPEEALRPNPFAALAALQKK